MEDVLEIQSPVVFDKSLAHYEIHAHQPYTNTTFKNSDEIRISIQHQDLCLLPSRSSLRVYGRLSGVRNEVLTDTLFVNNAICHMFEEIRYELNAIEIDKCKNVGLSTVMKNWLSLDPSQTVIAENADWLGIDENQAIVDANGYFDVLIPLSLILGFAESYRKVLVNVKHELILVRSSNDVNAVRQALKKIDGVDTFEEFKIDLTRIEWLMPYRDRSISMSFRSWELYEYPALPRNTSHVWTVKTANQLEKPRFVILGIEKMPRIRMPCYPYGNLNIDISKNQYATLYDMYANFQNSYYGKNSEPLLKKSQFINNMPLIVIDCSKQNESLKSAPVDVRLEFETKTNIPQGTAAYCLILHDRIIQYNPISSDVKKLI
ncbi:uncharacterized protein LOC131664173 [Phymastichus coffea]|uniref:uncharacterized protein LOC131664173 n=1 Tax=Phymastichus coffea TaxID=108790 RepID=UPI00273C39AA|nr:uncharacterized protein LOC131664173 [Phymastichus coffea]